MTMRPKRKGTDLSEFEDPLKNYDRPVFEDELERSLAEDAVSVIDHQPFKTVPPETAVEVAMKIMADLDIACLLITEGDKLIGIFSERDILTKVAVNFENVKNRSIRTVMTRDPVTVYVTDSPAKALNLMAVGGFRHVPILDVDDKLVGMLGPRRVTAYLQKYLQA